MSVVNRDRFDGKQIDEFEHGAQRQQVLYTEHHPDGTHIGRVPPVGSAILWPDNLDVPEGYVIADGRAVNRETYATLFKVYGGSQGTGNGTTSFNLPNYTAPSGGVYIIATR